MSPLASSRRYRAFTLVELLAVMGILAFLVTMVAVNYRVPLEEARLANAMDRIEGIDRRLRAVAMNSGTPTELRIDMEKACLSPKYGLGSVPVADTYVLPTGVLVDHLYISHERIDGKEVKIQYGSTGMTTTFAIGLASSDGRCRWLLVVGSTGQTLQVNDDETLRQLLSFEKVEARQLSHD